MNLKWVVLHLTLVLFITGCGVSRQIYKATLEESKARGVRLEQVSQELESSRQENTSLTQEVTALRGQVQDLSIKGSILAKDLNDLSKKKEELEIALNRCEAKRVQLEEALLQEPEGLKQKCIDLENQIENLMVFTQIKENEIVKLREDLVFQVGKNDSLNQEIERLNLKVEEIDSTHKRLVDELQEEIKRGEIKIAQVFDRLSITFLERILFDSGRTGIKPEGMGILERVGDILKEVSGKEIRVEGHTDGIPIGLKIMDKYPTNWELSTKRATNVVRYLQEKVGIDPRLLSATGFAMYRPVADNDTPEGRALNRRVEIILFPQDIHRVLEGVKVK